MKQVDVRVLAPLAVILALVGWGLGALPLSGAEPNGMFVDCGPALFGRPTPLPDPSCGAAYSPLPALSIALLLAALAAFAFVVSRYVWTRAPQVAR